MLLGVERGVPASTAMREAVAAKLDEHGKVALASTSPSSSDKVGDLPPPPPQGAGEGRGAAARRRTSRSASDRLSVADGAQAVRRPKPTQHPRARLNCPYEQWRCARARPGPSVLRDDIGAADALEGGVARRCAAKLAGYLFLLPWLDRLLRPDARADAGLALSVVHRLRPAAAPRLGRGWRTTCASPRPIRTSRPR